MSLDHPANHPRTGSDWIAPDCAGVDFFATDQGLRDLLTIYLPGDVLAALTPHYQRLGNWQAAVLTISRAPPTAIRRAARP